jgi:pseudaminic acid cytidylyltransferase
MNQSGGNLPVALIPARGGSKRLPRKNIHPFAGRPMLEWTIDAAKESGLFAEVYVSTEDAEIARIARDAGATVLDRPQEVASDTASLIDVVRHSIATDPSWPDTFCLLLPNCPLRTAEDIRAGHEALVEQDAPAMLSVVEYGWTPAFRALVETDAGLKFAFPETGALKSQHYPRVVCPSGAVYWARSENLVDAKTLYVPGIRGFQMPWHRAIDIDTEDDLRLAACLRYACDNGFSFEDSVS